MPVQVSSVEDLLAGTFVYRLVYGKHVNRDEEKITDPIPDLLVGEGTRDTFLANLGPGYWSRWRSYGEDGGGVYWYVRIEYTDGGASSFGVDRPSDVRGLFGRLNLGQIRRMTIDRISMAPGIGIQARYEYRKDNF